SVCTCFCPCIALARCTLLPYTTLFRSKEAEVEGKIWVVKNNDPHTDPDLFKGKTRLYYGRYDYKYEKAREMGALGVLIVHTTPSAGYGWNVVANGWSSEQSYLREIGRASCR